MPKNRLKNPIFLFYALVGYVLLQFSWWLYLIFSLYGEIYTESAKLEKKLLMLAGEGAVFLTILLLGVVMIRRAFKREKELNNQHENFLMSVSHELKTPISSLKLFLQTLTKRELSDEKRQEIYTRSLSDVNRLDSLVGNILLTKNISNKNFFLNPSTQSLDQFIQQKLNPLKDTLLNQHQLELHLDQAEYSFDSEAMESILINLIQNAAKYAPLNSKIEVNLRRSKNEILLEVKDEGLGIDPDQREKVFSKFYRVDNEMTRKSKGTGLGLFITKSLVEAHGGTIELKNNDPKGLHVQITFVL